MGGGRGGWFVRIGCGAGAEIWCKGNTSSKWIYNQLVPTWRR